MKKSMKLLVLVFLQVTFSHADDSLVYYNEDPIRHNKAIASSAKIGFLGQDFYVISDSKKLEIKKILGVNANVYTSHPYADYMEKNLPLFTRPFFNLDDSFFYEPQKMIVFSVENKVENFQQFSRISENDGSVRIDITKPLKHDVKRIVSIFKNTEFYKKRKAAYDEKLKAGKLSKRAKATFLEHFFEFFEYRKTGEFIDVSIGYFGYFIFYKNDIIYKSLGDYEVHYDGNLVGKITINGNDYLIVQHSVGVCFYDFSNKSKLKVVPPKNGFNCEWSNGH